jgi:hypothetical protein
MDRLVQQELLVHKALHQLLQVLLDTQVLQEHRDQQVLKVHKELLEQQDQLVQQVRKVFSAQLVHKV